MRFRGLVCLTIACVVTAARSNAAVAPDGAAIDNSGSTNTQGWHIVVRSDGQAAATQTARAHVVIAGATPAPFAIDDALVARFFRDVRSARDSGESPAACMKSASFGTRTIVTWHDWSSGDLSCPGNPPALAALARDVAALANAAPVSNLPARGSVQLRPDLPSPAPSPSASRSPVEYVTQVQCSASAQPTRVDSGV